MVISYVLGQRHWQDATGKPYESGIASTGSAELRFNVGYYVVAMLFVVFDLEAVFLFAWALVVREVGWTGFAGAMVFIVILLVGLFYEWRQGTFDFGPRPRARRARGKTTQVSEERAAEEPENVVAAR